MSETAATTKPVLRQAGEGAEFQQMQARVTVKLAAHAASGRVGAAEFLVPPGFGPPLHVHHREDELLVILEGQVRVVCGDQDLVLAAGGFAYLPRDVPHTFRTEGSQPTRMVAVFTPGGIEEMFTHPDVSLESLIEEHRVEHIGPPLEAGP
jgi:mannose-6-phosphate isomerase-like protein (cupin superfamily)